jgi:hypothetical protein
MILTGCEYDPSSGGGGDEKNSIQLSVDTWADGAIPGTGGEQWFKFTATAGTQYLHIQYGTLDDLCVQLYDGNSNTLGNRINFDESYGYSNSTDYASLNITSGQTYYLKVTPYSSSYSGTYRIAFNTMPLPPGKLTSATTLTSGTWANGNITATNSEQWFKFTATASTQYIHINYGTLKDLYVRLYDSNGFTLGNSIYFNGYNHSTSLMITSGQAYYLKVTPLSSSYSGTYRIAFSASATTPEG